MKRVAGAGIAAALLAGGGTLAVVTNDETPLEAQVAAMSCDYDCASTEARGQSWTQIAGRLAPDCVTSTQLSTFATYLRRANNGTNSPTPEMIVDYDRAEVPTCAVPSTTSSVASSSTSTSTTTTTTTTSPTTTSSSTTAPTTTSAPTTTAPSTTSSTTSTTVAPTTTNPDQSNAFIESFDGDPASPTPFIDPDWDVTFHHRGGLGPMNPVQAHHGSMCEPPLATHTVSTEADAVFLCRNHVMTSINQADYGVIYLTPNRMVDWSQGTATISFDVSTFISSQRDWIDVWVTPFDDALQLPLQETWPDLSGVPKRGLNFRALDGSFNTEIYQNYGSAMYSEGGVSWRTWLTPDAARRDTVEIKISSTHLSICMPADPVDGIPAAKHCWFDRDVPSLGFTQGVVQFGHHSYTPEKDCGTPNPPTSCTANTWHWDNVKIDRAVSFKMIAAQQDEIKVPRDNSNGCCGPPINETYVRTITFPQGAPASAFLRMAGTSHIPSSNVRIEVSYDNGATWIPTSVKLGSLGLNDKIKSLWTPIPAGVSVVKVRMNDGPTEDGRDGWMVRDISIWAR